MYSLVIPIFKNEENIKSLVIELNRLSTLLDKSRLFEVVFVIDGSPDQSYEIILSEKENFRFNSQIIKLSRNYGSFAAIKAGIQQAKGNFIAVMAADLQEPIELIADFFKSLSSDICDVVVGSRKTREDGFLNQAAADLFWKLYRKFINPEIPNGGVDIFGCNRKFCDELLKLKESRSSLIALIYWVGFRRLTIPYDRKKREFGKSAWSLKKKINYMMDSIYAFTDLPIRLLTWFGLISVMVSIALGIVVLYAKLTERIVVPGYTATILLILFFGGLNMLGLGVVGNYTWRGYENSKRRPDFLIQSHEIFKVN